MAPPRKCECGECRRCKHRAYMREWYRRKSPEERRAWVERKDRNRHNAAESARRRRDPEVRRKRNARNIVYRALRDGRLAQGVCEFASEDCKGQLEAHHEDYDRPLEVRWVCRAHHDSITHAEVF